jgi:type I restriction enzyme, S subunit
VSFTASLDEIVRANANGLLCAAAHWARVRLAEVASILNGFPFPSSSFTKDRGVPLLRIRDILGTSTEAYFDGFVGSEYLVHAGELVVGMDGDFNCGLWRGPVAALNQRVCKVSPDERFYDRRFLAYVLPGYLSAVNAETSSITVKHLSSRTVADIPLPLPPLAEQRRIVAAIEEHLSDLDAAVAALERVRANLKRYRAAVVEEAVAHRDGAGWATMRDLIEDGPQNGLYLPKSAYGVGTPILRIDDYQDWWSRGTAELRRVNADEATVEIYSLRVGDLVINRVNSPSHLGKSLVIEDRHVPALFESNMMRLRLKPEADPQFIALYLRSRSGRAALTANAKWAVNQASINQQDVLGTSVPLPALDAQQRIVAEVERLLGSASRTSVEVESQLRRAGRFRQAILRSAFEGKLVHQDPADEPASVLLDRIRTERAAVPTPDGRVTRALASALSPFVPRGNFHSSLRRRHQC